ncbi:AraC family transcriptional regulator [Deinococcus radiotolerans]|uniref:HTH araC/xylS-type domain-containing protein n=1 Tax=Deinococcus radiotolerans TaxID=1309407 RepID=A0ABQ2FIS5_9DEIO|nr:helix-turn-helix domain-containing protein [Deinococcus radiotolerans]GGL02310.1 hypothetical protein GCM10010844_21100 [Deinococcus radiotolerans]
MYQELPPSPPLRALVRTYWQLEEHHAPGEEYHHFMPERTVRVLFFSGDSWLAPDTTSAPERLSGAHLSGLSLTPRRLLSYGLTRALGIELYPWGAVQLFGWRMGVDQLDLGQLSAPVARAVPALLRAGAWTEAREVVDAWLLERLRDQEREPGVGIRAATQLYHSLGTARIGPLAETLNVSARALERAFSQEVGVGAKTLARLIRFEEAHNRLHLNPDEPLAGLAYDLGFADQAHLTREFRALAHMTPRTFREYARQMQHRHDALQDEGLYTRRSPLVHP